MVAGEADKSLGEWESLLALESRLASPLARSEGGWDPGLAPPGGVDWLPEGVSTDLQPVHSFVLTCT